MSLGRKRIRPVLDTSVEDEDDVQSEKFARMRSRARVATKTTGGNGRNSAGNSSNSSANVTSNSVSIFANSSQGSSVSGGGGGTFSKKTSTFEEKLRRSKPKPFFLIGRDSDERKPYQKPPIREKRNSNPRKLYKKKHSGGTPVSNRRTPVTSHGFQTPEFMKVKEDDSLLEEKKDRKRRRNKIMSLRTAKGQPVMRGRIALMLEEIKASTQQN